LLCYCHFLIFNCYTNIRVTNVGFQIFVVKVLLKDMRCPWDVTFCSAHVIPVPNNNLTVIRDNIFPGIKKPSHFCKGFVLSKVTCNTHI
jgi:hypothetical protein